MNNDELEKLKKRLYRKGETFGERGERVPLTPAKHETRRYWEGAQAEKSLYSSEKPKSFFGKKFLFVAIGVFVLAGFGLSAYYFFFSGPSIISSKNIEIKLDGPSNIKGGEEGSWLVDITNKNETDIELADLIIEYPGDSRPISDSLKNTEPPSERRPVGSIKAGQTVTEQIRAYLFGEKDSEKKFKLSLEYRPQGSNAILEKTYEATVRLLQSPVEISVEMPQEANSGELFSFKVDIISNSETVVRNIHLKMEYPAGFHFQEADLKPSSGDNIWRLGDLEPNKKRTITIKGVLEGQDQIEMAFRALSGPVDEKGEIDVYGFNVSTLTLKKPFLGIGVRVNEQADGEVFSPNDDFSVNIEWQNTLPVKIYNASIEVKISGDAVDRQTIFVNKGFYRSFDQALIWNQTSVPELAVIDPLVSGMSQFRFNIFKPLSQSVITAGNPTITMDIEMKAERVDEQGKTEIKNHLTKKIKIATLFQLNRRAFYYSGPFKNTGPIPPKSGKETTYTIIWSLSNTSSEVIEAAVSAFLPPYIRWLGVIKPQDADVTYNQETGEIVWKPGTVSAGTGAVSVAKELAFQISFLPNASQIGTLPVLVSEATLSGKDSFTGAFLRDVRPAQTTNLESDAQFQYNNSIVVQ